jgi:hypothetical protein
MTNLDENTIRALHDAGLLRSKYSDYKRIHRRVIELQGEGHSRLDASYKTGDELGASLSTVYLAYQTMEKL